MGLSRIDMLNRALLRIGAVPLVSELDPGAPQHIAVYDSVLERVFAQPWHFAKTVRRLVRLDAAPDPAHFLYAYKIPPDMIGAPRAVYADADSRQSITDYDIEGDLLLTDATQIWLAFSRLVDPPRWPGDVRELFVQALMAELALSVREDRTLHDRLWQKAFGTPSQNGVGGLMAVALEADSQGSPSTIIGGGFNPLIDCR